jgi:hypothetical protein
MQHSFRLNEYGKKRQDGPQREDFRKGAEHEQAHEQDKLPPPPAAEAQPQPDEQAREATPNSVYGLHLPRPFVMAGGSC